MGKNQSTVAQWSANDVAFGNGPNAVSIEEVIEEVGRIPEKYFGGEAIENDSSMHQMHHDLLAIDEKLKSFFSRKKAQQSRNDYSSADPYDAYQIQQQTSRDSGQNHDYLEPISIIGMDPSSSFSMTHSQTYLLWRCGNCTMENKIGERVCRRCGQAETRF